MDTWTECVSAFQGRNEERFYPIFKVLDGGRTVQRMQVTTESRSEAFFPEKDMRAAGHVHKAQVDLRKRSLWVMQIWFHDRIFLFYENE